MELHTAVVVKQRMMTGAGRGLGARIPHTDGTGLRLSGTGLRLSGTGLRLSGTGLAGVCLAGIWLLGVWNEGREAWAQPGRKSPSGRHVAGAQHPAGHPGLSTLDRLVSDVNDKLGRHLPKDFARKDFALALLPDVSGSAKLRELRATVVRLILGRQGRRGFRSFRLLSGKTSETLVERARAAGIELLWTLRLKLSGGYVHLRGELFDTSTSLWRDIASPRRGSLCHVHGQVRVDAEIASYLGQKPSRRMSFVMRKTPLRGAGIVAAAGGDVDGDGHAELVLLRQNVIEIHQLNKGRWSLQRQVQLPIPPADLPSRRVVGTLRVERSFGQKRGRILLNSTALAFGAALGWRDGRWQVEQRLAGHPMVPASAGQARLLLPKRTWVDYFEPRWIPGAASAVPMGPGTAGSDPRTPSPTAGAAGPLTRPIYGLRAHRLITAKGARDFAATVDLQGRLRLYKGLSGNPLATTGPVGVAFALADLDDDGAIDVVVSSASAATDDDTLALLTLSKGGFRTAWQSPPLGGRVEALTHGDFDGDGALELVAIICKGAACAVGVFR